MYLPSCNFDIKCYLETFEWTRILQQEKYDREKEMETLRNDREKEMETLRNEFRQTARQDEEKTKEKDFERQTTVRHHEEKMKENELGRNMRLKKQEEEEKEEASKRTERELRFKDDLSHNEYSRKFKFATEMETIECDKLKEQAKIKEISLEEEQIKLEKLKIFSKIISDSPNTDAAKLAESLK